MSQWKQIQQLEVGLLEHVDYLYNDNFPMDVRQGLADWIEGQDWETAERNESMAAMLFTNLLGQLERSCAQEPNFLQRHNLKIIHQQLQMKYNTNPGLIARVISNCLREERRILSSACMQQQVVRHPRLTYSLSIFSSELNQLMDQAVKYIEDMQDEFDLRYKTLQSRGNLYSLVTCDLHPELLEWRRRQQVSIIGGPLLTGLDLLQNWFTGTAHSLFQIKRQLDKLGELVVKVTYEGDPIPLQTPHMAETVRCLVYLVIKSSFVVEVQPCMPTHPQRSLIIKTGVQFTTKVRLLVKLPEVDYQLKVKTTFDKNRQFFILTNSTKAMDVEDSANGCLSVEFRHLGLLSVTEELHSLSFEAHFMVLGLAIDLETTSLPLVVISNVSQLPAGWASVMWYNLLTDEPRNLGYFGNPPRASWSQLSEVLSWQFSSFAGRGLNPDQLLMLGEKLLAGTSVIHVSLSHFCLLQENIPGKAFSFWIWLESILELIRKHLLPVWNDNYIMGFVSKEKERALLKGKEGGTFLLRFSESHLGGITFTWVEQADNGESNFTSVEPYTKSRLIALPFADILRNYKVISEGLVTDNPLKFLYPNIPKDEAFSRYYNSPQSKGNATVSVLVCVCLHTMFQIGSRLKMTQGI
uniref:Signal transducer and activator of transcription n=1 Tax=Gadus morhua TaxID=8049 RepID=A0A8C5A6K1_GADMO